MSRQGYRQRIKTIAYTDVDVDANSPEEAVEGALMDVATRYSSIEWDLPPFHPSRIAPMGAPRPLGNKIGRSMYPTPKTDSEMRGPVGEQLVELADADHGEDDLVEIADPGAGDDEVEVADNRAAEGIDEGEVSIEELIVEYLDLEDSFYERRRAGEPIERDEMEQAHELRTAIRAALEDNNATIGLGDAEDPDGEYEEDRTGA